MTVRLLTRCGMMTASGRPLRCQATHTLMRVLNIPPLGKWTRASIDYASVVSFFATRKLDDNASAIALRGVKAELRCFVWHPLNIFSHSSSASVLCSL